MARLWPDSVAGDKGYRASELRYWLQAHDIDPAIPSREEESEDHAYDRETYRERPINERTINRLKRYRRIATRYEKLAISYVAIPTITMIVDIS